MRKTPEERDAASMAKVMVLACLRNTTLEDMHGGKYPISKTGDYSDVKVIDGTGREIPWSVLARFNDDEMKTLIKAFVSRMYTFLLMNEESDKFKRDMDYWTAFTGAWDDPEKDDFIARVISSTRVAR